RLGPGDRLGRGRSRGAGNLNALNQGLCMGISARGTEQEKRRHNAENGLIHSMGSVAADHRERLQVLASAGTATARPQLREKYGQTVLKTSPGTIISGAALQGLRHPVPPDNPGPICPHPASPGDMPKRTDIKS